MSEPILGWKIDRDDRERLLARFPPRYGEAVAEHITFDRKSAAPSIGLEPAEWP